MTDINIRNANDTDGDGIAALIAAIFAEYEGCLFDRAAEFPELDAIATHFAQRGGNVWVAEQAGKVVGSFAVCATPDPAVFEIFKVYLARELRGRGIARTLLDKATALARTRGATALILWTDTRFLDAHRFYERNGFVRLEGARPLHDISDTWEYPYRRALDATG